jgi:HK97 family phage major capsid protein/HK97 family phage prohead protease
MEKKRDLENQIQHRSQPVEFDIKEDRTIEFSFSSTNPVNRGALGNEILDHREGAIDFSRLNDAAPLLFNHDPNKPIGVVEKAWLKNERGYARVRFSDNPFPSEVFNDVRNGILRGVSVGYSVNDVERLDDDKDSYLVRAWQPAEISIAVIAADPEIGIGRAKEVEKTDVTMSTQQESSNMETQRNNAVASTDAPQSKPDSKTQMTTTPDLEVVRSEASKKAASDERNRIREISVVCERHQLGDELKETLITEGTSIEETRKIALERINAKPVETVAPVELNEKEQCDYEISAGIRSLLTGDWSSREAGYVRELSRDVELKGHKRSTEKSFFVPFTALSERATYVAGTANVGGNLVATDLLAGDFIQALRNQSVMLSAGVRTINGLVGDVAIPRQSGVGSTYWLSSETTAITFSNSTFDQIQMSPKNLAAIQKHSRQVLLQGTPGIEQLIRDDLRDGLQLAMDLAILNGSGSSGQPTGIMNTSSINSVAIGTNGGAITMDKVVDLETAVMEDNGAVNTGTVKYITNAKVVGALKKLKTSGGEYLYNQDLQAIGRGGTPATLNGWGVLSSNQVPSNLTKGSSSGVCNALVYGDFSQCITGFWGGGLEITVGEDQDDFSKALTSIRGIMTLDVAVRNPVSFGTIADITV